MKKYIKILFTSLVAIIIISGCGVQMPEMTEEQNKLIVEYAAGLILKYDKNHNKLLMDVDDLPIETPTPTPTEIPTVMPTNSPVEDNLDNNSDKEIIDGTQEDIPIDLATFLDLNGIDISYIDYEICKSYPQGSDEDVYISMDAAEGKQLVVVKFQITNQLEESNKIDLLNKDLRFRIFINNGKQINTLTTMLLDDLATLNMELLPNEIVNAVLIIEVNPEIVENITHMKLLVKLPDESATIELISDDFNTDETISDESTTSETISDESTTGETISDESTVSE